MDELDDVSFSPDGQTLATASDDHTIELSTLNADRAIDRICATTANNLTEQQRRRYLPELPFRPPWPMTGAGRAQRLRHCPAFVVRCAAIDTGQPAGGTNNEPAGA